jgi:hypothetical protein
VSGANSVSAEANGFPAWAARTPSATSQIIPKLRTRIAKGNQLSNAAFIGENKHKTMLYNV